MSRPFTVTTAKVREYIAAADAKYEAILTGATPPGQRYVSGMEIADAMGWAKADTRKKITTALMNLRPRSLFTVRYTTYDRNEWMNGAIPAMVEELIGEFENDDVLDLVAATGEIPAGVTL